MNDDIPGGDTPTDPPAPRMPTLDADLPKPKSHGLFRRPSRSLPTGFSEDQASLRLVSSRSRPISRPRTAPPMPSSTSDIWDALPSLPPGPNAQIAPQADPISGAPVASSFDALRTTLLRELRSNGWNRKADEAPTAGCGASFTAANLAASLARVPGSRTVLLDLNLHRPTLARHFDTPARGDMRGFLAGTVRLGDQLQALSDTLALGLAHRPDAHGAARLQSDCCAIVVNDLVDRLCPDLLICDVPPMLENEDLAGFLPQVDGVLLVADAMKTRPDHITECENRLKGQTRVLGVVLNQARRAGPLPLLV